MTLGMVSTGFGLVFILLGFIIGKGSGKHVKKSGKGKALILAISSGGIGGIAVIFGLYAMVVNIL